MRPPEDEVLGRWGGGQRLARMICKWSVGCRTSAITHAGEGFGRRDASDPGVPETRSPGIPRRHLAAARDGKGGAIRVRVTPALIVVL